MRHPHHRQVQLLGLVFVLVFSLLAVAPSYRADWLLENWLVFGCAVLLVVSYQRAPMSRGSYIAIALFLSLHEIGAHYTYSEVPYDAWLRSAAGVSINDVTGWTRNHFDRFVHFSYGLLLAYPTRELCLRVTRDTGFWSYFLALNLTVAGSLWYELIEWAAAAMFGGELGMAYLGTQGDVWDAHRDMGLAVLGAALSLSATAASNRLRQRDPAAEWTRLLAGTETVPGHRPV